MKTIRTRTMAELYLRQGHPKEALDILLELSAAQPDDAALASLMETARAALEKAAQTQPELRGQAMGNQASASQEKRAATPPERQAAIETLNRLLERVRQRRRP